MLYLLGKFFSWNVLRLLSSHAMLLAMGAMISGFLTWYILPKLWDKLPHDHGKAFVKDGAASKGKPTGAGALIAMVVLPTMIAVVPPDWSVYGCIVCLFAMMRFGFLDDASAVAWGRLKKGLLDLACVAAVAFFMCKGQPVDIWLPFHKGVLTVGPLWYMAIATAVLFFTVNAMNCSDGVDGLAGSLGLVSLLSLSGLLYLVIGYAPVANYLLIPCNPNGARWAIMSMCVTGGIAGYLWHNANPSLVLMGDAGSRMIGLALGIAVLATGNPLFVIVVAPVMLLNGGGGLVKITLLQALRRLGFDTTPPFMASPEQMMRQKGIVRLLHGVRFPLHDHCKYNWNWSNAQVLMRFVILQSFLVPLLFALFIKVR